MYLKTLALEVSVEVDRVFELCLGTRLIFIYNNGFNALI